MTESHDTHWEKIAGKIHGELSSEDEAEFDKMMSNDTCYQEFQKAQRIKGQLAITGPIEATSKPKSWKKIENGLRSFKLRWIKTAIQYAAVMVAAFLAGNLLRPFITEKEEIRYSEIAVPFGQMSQITLSDGTKIWLNSGTTLKYPDRFAEYSRCVSINGEAYFEVAKMPDKPFTVNTADMNIQVLGTSFNLSAYREDAFTSVTLVEGKVAVQNNIGKTIATLTPGQMATKEKSETKLRIDNVETSFFSAWTEGKIFFEDERLDQIAIKLERWFNVEIAFTDDDLKSYKFTGTILKNKPVDQIMQALQILSPINYKHQINANGKDIITIYKRT